MNKAVFLDRDGTINVEKNYLYKKEDFQFLDNSVEGMRILQNDGFYIIIITNQSGIGRGYYSEEDFFDLNSWMIKQLSNQGVSVQKVYYCPHLPDAKKIKYRMDCECRKPKLGMFYKAVEEFDLDLSECYAIGDKIRDCSICATSACNGYLIGNNESIDIINEVESGGYQRVRWAQNLYSAALDIHNRLLNSEN